MKPDAVRQSRIALTRRLFCSAALLLAALLLAACGPDSKSGVFRDGYYTAEMAEFDSHGWKEFISIYVNRGSIVTVEYDAKNASGFIKSWDPDYMRHMNARSGNYPNKYARNYAHALLTYQDPLRIDALTGATESYHTFLLLASAVLDRARTGTKLIAFVSARAEP
ncbi:MAG: FMN-binding protein [Treponema sp.]|nr:FMN-binding protein [Treponema sp.]